jgi:hypothetical protein
MMILHLQLESRKAEVAVSVLMMPGVDGNPKARWHVPALLPHKLFTQVAPI